MKKLVSVLLSLPLMLSGITAFADTNPSVYIDGEKLEFDVNPFIEDGRTLVPMRKIFEELGCSVEYYVDTEGLQTIVARRVEDYMYLVIGKDTMYVNGEDLELDVPAKIVSDRTFVPLRAVSESLKAKVDWIDKTKTVDIESSHGDHIVRAKNIAEYEDKYEISVSYPYIENKDNDEYIKKLNAEFESEAKKAFETNKEALIKQIAESEDLAEKIIFQRTFRVNCDADGIFSLSNYDYSYCGGAHPFSTMLSYNYNLDKKEEIKLADILEIKETELEQLVYDNFKEKLESDGLFDDIWDEALKESAKNVNFYLTDTMVTLYFNQYEVAPYAAGMPAIDFIIGEEYADYYAELMEIVSGTEIGTAGSSLKAIDKLKEIAKWFDEYKPSDEEFTETMTLSKDSIPAENQKDFDKQTTLLCSAFKDILKNNKAEENELSEKDLVNIAKFVVIVDKENSNLILPYVGEFDENGTYFGKINEVSEGKITVELMWDNIYDAVELSQMKKGDMILVSNGLLLVDKIEEIKNGKKINGGLEEMGADFAANDGGTFVETLWDDDVAKKNLGEFTLEVSNDVVLADKSDLDVQKHTVYNGKEAVLKVCSEENINYGTLEILVEDNIITSITKHYHP